MRRALRGAVGTLLVSSIVGLTRPATAQTPSVPANRTTPARTVRYEGNIAASDGRGRAEEMKVELALLADLATFPYYLGGRVSGGNLELRGYVPNDLVRQRALHIARRNTSLRVIDGLEILAHPRGRPSAPSPETLQTEAAELLRKQLGENAGRIHVDARSDGVVTLTGTVGSIEDKLALCKQFRQLSGCNGIFDQVSVQPILRDGQRVVPLSKDGKLTVSPSVAKPAPSSLLAQEEELRLPTTGTSKQTGIKTADSSAKKSTTSAALTKPVVPWTSTATAKANDARTVKPPPPVMKWGQPAMTWESQTKPRTVASAAKDSPSRKNKADTSASGKGSDSAGYVMTMTAPSTPQRWQHSGGSEESEPRIEPLTKPAQARASATPRGEKQPSPSPTDRKAPAILPESITRQAVPPTAPAAVAPRTPAAVAPRTPAAVAPKAPAVAAPKAPAPALPPATIARSIPAPTPIPTAQPTTAKPRTEVLIRPAPIAAAKPAVERPIDRQVPAVSPRRSTPPPIVRVARLDRPSHWPPAYDIRPAQPKDGRPGIIEFEDEPDPPPAPMTAPTARLGPVARRVVVPAELRRDITAICGKEAREIIIEQQGDGSVQVRVKVASAAIGDRLTQKILSIPEMASPKVRLTMDVSSFASSR